MKRLLTIFFIFISLSLLASEVDRKLVINEIQLQAKYDVSNKVFIFRGIPYAKPPVNELRWKSPLPPERLQAIDARSFKSACMQDTYNTEWYYEVIKAFGSDRSLFSHVDSVSEDCLYLNIWTNSIDSTKKKPVMVWIHGGNDIGGWSYEPDYWGHNLAKNEVLVVSIAYRLNIFGFFQHPEIKKGTGNFGLEDQIQALKWIKENIEYFGGDSNNITLFGESAGGAHISYHIASPLSKGLFHKAIIQSGGYNLVSSSVLGSEENANLLGLKVQNLSSSNNLDELKKLSSDEVLNISSKLYHPFHPIIEGALISNKISKTYRDGPLNNVDLIIGSNKNEDYLYVDHNLKLEDLKKRIKQNYPIKVSDILDMLDLKDIRLAADYYGTNQLTTCPSNFIARSMTDHGNTVYQYSFHKKRANSKKILAYHGAEIPYIFDTHADYLPTDKEDRILTQQMMEYWIHFSKNGNPNSKNNIVSWKPFGGEENYIIFDSKIVNEERLERQFCNLIMN